MQFAHLVKLPVSSALVAALFGVALALVVPDQFAQAQQYPNCQ